MPQVPVLWLFWRLQAGLGRNWSPRVEVRESHALGTHGVYARIRCPMYAALWLWALSQPLLLHNLIAGVLSIPAIVAVYMVRIPREETMMRDLRRGVGRLRYAHRVAAAEAPMV